MLHLRLRPRPGRWVAGPLALAAIAARLAAAQQAGGEAGEAGVVELPLAQADRPALNKPRCVASTH